jgi:hypothetical protein
MTCPLTRWRILVPYFSSMYMIVIGHSHLSDGAAWCMMFIDCWWLMFMGLKYLEQISRIRTEHLLNNMNTEQKKLINTEHWIK